MTNWTTWRIECRLPGCEQWETVAEEYVTADDTPEAAADRFAYYERHRFGMEGEFRALRIEESYHKPKPTLGRNDVSELAKGLWAEIQEVSSNEAGWHVAERWLDLARLEGLVNLDTWQRELLKWDISMYSSNLLSLHRALERFRDTNNAYMGNIYAEEAVAYAKLVVADYRRIEKALEA